MEHPYVIEEIVLNYTKFTIITVERELDGKLHPLQVSLSGHCKSLDKIKRVVDELYQYKIH